MLAKLFVFLLAAFGALADLQIGVLKSIPESECKVKSKAGDSISVHYEGTLEDGTVFDSSYNRGQPIVFGLGTGQVIKGWDQGLTNMCIGEKRKLVIPPDLAYGTRGIGPIPPLATLIMHGLRNEKWDYSYCDLLLDMPPNKTFVRALQEFLTSGSDFKVIYSSQNEFITPRTKRICILDSSFNPPHLGHFSLAKESLQFNFQGKAQSNEEKLLLLLLSVKNADKVAPVPASFEDRIEMMYLMANYLHENLKVPVSIGLTKHAKFVDKSVSILSYIHSLVAVPDSIRLTFLVGFDTLIRIFNPKYYLPDKLLDSLESFMRQTDLFCLTRNDHKSTYQDQREYVSNISNGQHEHIPSNWSLSIFLFDKGADVDEGADIIGSISSSAIRKAISEKGWFDHVIPEIKDYIIQENLYTNI